VGRSVLDARDLGGHGLLLVLVGVVHSLDHSFTRPRDVQYVSRLSLT
jgi:hypothetical protein